MFKMKKIAIASFLLVFSGFIAWGDVPLFSEITQPSVATLKTRVMTYNILCRRCYKGPYEEWSLRIKHLQETVVLAHADLVGLQELGSWNDVQDFQSVLPNHKPVVFENASLNRYDAVFFYYADRFTLIQQGGFWLSKHPYSGGLRNWNIPSMPRHLNWALLEEKETGKRFIFSNTHFDNNIPNQEKSAELVIREFSQRFKNIPIIFAGDMNSSPETEAYKKLSATYSDIKLENTFSLSHVRAAAEPAHAESAGVPDNIDHVFVGNASFRVTSWAQWRNSYRSDRGVEMMPSDHLPIIVELEFQFDNPSHFGVTE